jgi:hypothetical protein
VFQGYTSQEHSYREGVAEAVGSTVGNTTPLTDGLHTLVYVMFLWGGTAEITMCERDGNVRTTTRRRSRV